MVAAGTSSRFGRPKQFEFLGARRVVDWSLQRAMDLTDHVILVVPAEQADTPEASADRVVAGGASRSESVRAGLAAVPEAATFVLVQDAARPMATVDTWLRVLEALEQGADAVVPVVPVTDTLREVDGTTVDRDRFVAVQTPQGFKVDVLRAAHNGDPEGTDDASLAERAGFVVTTVEGDPGNIKITHEWDLATAKAIVE